MSCLYQDMSSSIPMEWKALHLEVLPETVLVTQPNPTKYEPCLNMLALPRRSKGYLKHLQRQKSGVLYNFTDVLYRSISVCDTRQLRDKKGIIPKNVNIIY